MVLRQCSLGTVVLGQWSWDSCLGTVVLGQYSLGTVILGQWSWDSGLRTVVLGQYSLVTVQSWDSSLRTVGTKPVEPPTDYYLNFCTKMDTKLVNDTQQLVVVVVEPLLVAPCTACRISLLPRPFRIERKSADPSGLSAIYH